MTPRKRPNFLEREGILRKSGVREVFTPHTPVAQDRYLRGRESEVSRLLAQFDTPGQHGLLFGSRGVGKSSLAQATSRLLTGTARSARVFNYRADSQTQFEDIVAEPLLEMGVDVDVTESETQSSSETGWRGGVPFLGARGSRRRGTKQRRSRPDSIKPADAAKRLQGAEGLLIIDEAEAAPLRTMFHVSELIKQMSDIQSPLKLLVVGIAETASDLTASHPSVSRCLMEIHVGPMADDHLSEIVTLGADTLDLQFDTQVVRSIVTVSRGYPHFTHLLALKCSEIAILSGNERIGTETLNEALTRAYIEAEGQLRKKYGDAVRSASPRYREILTAASNLVGEHHREFTAKDLRDQLSRLVGEIITQGELNNYLRRLVADDASAVLTRTKKGVYCFSDPRMPSLVLIANGRLD